MGLVIGDRGPAWAKPTLDELLAAYFDGGDKAVYGRLSSADNLCPDCLRGLVVQLIHQYAAQVLEVEFVDLGS